MKKKVVLVTGGAGFIGSHLVHSLVRSPDNHVINLDKLTYAAVLPSISELTNRFNYQLEVGDVCDTDLVFGLLFRYRPDAVIHLAAETHVDRSIEGPESFLKTNVIGTFNLLECCLKYWHSLSPIHKDSFRFLHVSTDEVFGSLGGSGRFVEESPYQPNSPYSASKAASDHFVRAYHTTYGLPVLTTHCSNNYGPRQNPEKLIPKTILNAFRNKKIPIYGDGENIRDWIFVEDHTRALQTLLNKGIPGEAYNVGGRCEHSNLEIVNLICDSVRRFRPSKDRLENLIEFVDDRPGHDQRYAVDCSKLEHEIGWKAETALKAGIDATVRWYHHNEDWVRATSNDVDPEMEAAR